MSLRSALGSEGLTCCLRRRTGSTSCAPSADRRRQRCGSCRRKRDKEVSRQDENVDSALGYSRRLADEEGRLHDAGRLDARP